MATDPPADFGIGQIVEELRDLRARRLTGTYFVVSVDNHQARIGLVDGEIESLTYRGVEGPRALAGLAGIRALRSRFSAGALRKAAAATSLPPTETLLKALLSGAAAAAAVTGGAAETAPASGGGRRVAELSAAEVQWIRAALTDYLGPIAGLIYDEKWNPALAVETLLAELAAEIPGSQRGAEFLATVRRGLYKSD